MFNSLKIGEKIGAGFAAILLLMIATSVLGLMKINQIMNDLNEIGDERYPKVMLGNEMIKRSLVNGRTIRGAILSSDTAEVEKYIQDIRAFRRENTEALRKIEAMLHTPKGKELHANILAARDRLSAAYDKMYPLLTANNDTEATAFLKAEFAPANDVYMAALEEMNKYQSESMDKSLQDAKSTYSGIRTMMITFATISVAIGVAIAVTLGKSLSNQVALVVRQNERIADGDFSPNKNLLLLPARTEFGHLINTQETMRTKLIAALEEVRASAFQVNSSALELASTSEQVATSVQRQADSTAAASATLEELSVSIDHVSENANDASRQASQAGKLTEQGASNVRDSVACIDSVHDSVRQTCDEMATLKEEVTNIGNIVTVIREVADQTNLLALNAAIEAARAGESGRGFAVVADEVRKLAERTTNSAQEITQMIHSIQGKSERVVSSMTGSQQSVGGATESADKTRTIIGEVQRGAGEALGAISKINTALSEQRLASQNLAKTMETVAQLAEENSATVEELAANSRTLMDLSGSMRQVVERFRW